MRILDIYIARRFLSNLLFSIIAFVSIYIIIDAVERLSEYIDKGAPTTIIIKYYLFYIPFIIILVMPISTLLASMFSVGRLSKNNEILAMKASGISLNRILAPLFVLGLLISIFMIYFAEVVMPWANTQKALIKRRYIDRMPRAIPSQIANLYFQDRYKRKIFIGYFNSHDHIARKVNILEFNGVYVRHRIDAEMMRWGKDGWVLINGYERRFDDHHETARPFKQMKFPDLQLKPADISAVQKDPEEMSFQELQHFIEEVKRNGGDPDRWLVDLYLKISFPFANLIIVLFGAPLASSRIRSTGALGVAMSIMACFIYFGAVKIGQTLGQMGTLHPLVAAWLGNIIFGLASIWLLIKMPK
ncbi:MAG: LPS export ABC transporter permease LptG [Calditrichaeota bacterium]|nr:MAG: LPS export ABC transporter permease LptG [Calditrichota bacterium]